MKILKKRDIKKVAFNYPSDIGLDDFLKIYKKCTTEPFKDEKLRYYINRRPVKISPLSSGDIDKYGCSLINNRRYSLFTPIWLRFWKDGFSGGVNLIPTPPYFKKN